MLENAAACPKCDAMAESVSGGKYVRCPKCGLIAMYPPIRSKKSRIREPAIAMVFRLLAVSLPVVGLAIAAYSAVKSSEAGIPLWYSAVSAAPWIAAGLGAWWSAFVASRLHRAVVLLERSQDR